METNVEIVKEYDTDGNMVGKGITEPVTDEWTDITVNLPVSMKFKYDEDNNIIHIQLDTNQLEQTVSRYIGNIVKQLSNESILTEDK